MSTNYTFSMGIMERINGFKIKGLEPDKDGFFDMVIGCLGIPTRAGVIYDIASSLQCLKDRTARFNICLEDGNLSGEYGHPVIRGRDDMPRLLMIDESKMSHYFGRVWADPEPIMIRGMEAVPIRAKIKPRGPFGDILEKELRDPHLNSSFSIRSVCLPMQGADSRYEYRKVQSIVTFDAVHAPGYEITSKRYVGAMESLTEIKNITTADMDRVIAANVGRESSLLISRDEVNRLREKDAIFQGRDCIGYGVSGNQSYLDINNEPACAQSLIYSRRR